MRIFSLFIYSKRSSTPSLAFKIASDEPTVRMMAERTLQESPNHLRVEVREADRLLFRLERDGAFYRVPLPATIGDALRDGYSRPN